MSKSHSDILDQPPLGMSDEFDGFSSFHVARDARSKDNHVQVRLLRHVLELPRDIPQVRHIEIVELQSPKAGVLACVKTRMTNGLSRCAFVGILERGDCCDACYMEYVVLAHRYCNSFQDEDVNAMNRCTYFHLPDHLLPRVDSYACIENDARVYVCTTCAQRCASGDEEDIAIFILHHHVTCLV